MFDSKLLRIVNSFAKDEWKRAHKFVLLEAEESSDAHQFYRYLSKHRHHLNSNHISIDKAHQKLFPHKTRKGFQNVMSKLSNILEDYLRWDWLKKNKDDYDLSLLQALNSRGLFHLFDLKAELFRKNFPDREEIDLWGNVRLMMVNHLQSFSDNPNERIGEKNYLDTLTENLVAFTTDCCSYYSFAMQYETLLSNTEYPVSLPLLFQFPKFQEISPISKLFYTFNEVLNFNLEQKEILLAQVTEEPNKFTDEINKNILMVLLRAENLAFKKGETETPSKILDLYKFGIESGILRINNKIPYLRFVNIVNVMCASKQFDEARTFIESNGSSIIEEYQEGTIYISNAQLAFNEGNYEKVITLLSTRSFQKFIHTNRMRWLLLCSYFMVYQDDLNFMDNVFRNFNNYIKANKRKMSKSSFEGSVNLAKILSKVLINKDQSLLKEELSSNKNIVFRSWLSRLKLSKKKISRPKQWVD